jgi:phosphatidylserine decarboxylase
MAQRRRGDCQGTPHEILDPRDLKYCRNVCTCHWAPEHDPFAWRDRLPFARWGLAELQLMGWPLAALTALAGWLAWYAAIVPAFLLFVVVFFFRSPLRSVPQGPGVVVAPADGKVVEIVPVDDDPFLGCPAVRISIFLSIFNVHLNRAPLAARVIALRYARGDFVSALDPQSAERNENMWIGLEEDAAPHRRLAVRQIAGAVARRIVCAARPGETLARGAPFGMIKFGSRTELILPAAGLKLEVRVGSRIQAGSSVVARYAESPAGGSG